MQRIAVLGGGPGGLYFALLLKTADPARQVVVFERNRVDDTFGFGVVFSAGTLSTLADGDDHVHELLLAGAVHWDAISVRHRGRRLECRGNGFAAIGRMALLGILQERCREVGVELRFQTETTVERLAGFDLVVAADGANSGTREALADRLEPSYETASAKFIWFGTTKRFDELTFLFEKTERGWFGVHAYPYDSVSGRSTFIVETSAEAWSAGNASREYVQEAFAQHLDGHALLDNNSRWANFRTLRCQRWVAGRVALLGDAVHTAHFSVGSGTKMAMEDALALARAIGSEPDLERALTAYEDQRRQAVARIQAAARPSLWWWEHFGEFAEAFEPEQFAFHFLTRIGRFGKSGLASRDAGFVAGVERWFGGGGVETRILPLDQARGLADTVVVAPAAESGLDAAVARLTALVQSGVRTVGLRAAGDHELDHESLLCFRRLAELARLRLGAQVVVLDARIDREWAETLILSGRSDYVGLGS